MTEVKFNVNIFTILGILYVAMWFIIGIQSIGTRGTCDVYPWYISIEVLAVMIFPFALGYLAGKEI